MLTWLDEFILEVAATVRVRPLNFIQGIEVRGFRTIGSTPLEVAHDVIWASLEMEMEVWRGEMKYGKKLPRRPGLSRVLETCGMFLYPLTSKAVGDPVGPLDPLCMALDTPTAVGFADWDAPVEHTADLEEVIDAHGSIYIDLNSVEWPADKMFAPFEHGKGYMKGIVLMRNPPLPESLSGDLSPQDLETFNKAMERILMLVVMENGGDMSFFKIEYETGDESVTMAEKVARLALLHYAYSEKCVKVAVPQVNTHVYRQRYNVDKQAKVQRQRGESLFRVERLMMPWNDTCPRVVPRRSGPSQRELQFQREIPSHTSHRWKGSGEHKRLEPVIVRGSVQAKSKPKRPAKMKLHTLST
jgi:hypothetical protein